LPRPDYRARNDKVKNDSGKNMDKKVKNLLIAGCLAVGLTLFLVPAAKAVNLQDAFNGQLSTVGSRSGFNTNQTTVEPIISMVISVVLSFLGVIFLIFMVYGGYIWMTAAGNEEKVKKAKMLIQAAVLGLLIVVGAYAITVFIMGRLAKDLIPSDSGTGSLQNAAYDATSATDTAPGCCIVPPTSSQPLTCHDVDNEEVCTGTFDGGVFVPGPCSGVSGCNSNNNTTMGCCVTTNAPRPPALNVTYTCDPAISNAFCNPALTGNPVYYDTECPKLSQCQ
jgi:hypothetical protein